MSVKQIGVRLSAVEFAALRRIPGDTDSDRVRALIHNQSISAGLATQIAMAVTSVVEAKLNQVELALASKISDVHPAPIVRRLAEQLNPILSELVINTRKIR